MLRLTVTNPENDEGEKEEEGLERKERASSCSVEYCLCLMLSVSGLNICIVFSW